MVDVYRPPKGWTATSGTLEPDRTLAGYLARGQIVRGHCHTRDCKRSCHVDVEHLVKRGLGTLRMSKVTDLMRCHHLDSCSLYLIHEKRPEGLPLFMLTGSPHVQLRVSCEHCRFTRTAAVEAVIAKLQAEKRGGPDTRSNEVAGLIKGACKCGVTRWKVEVAWPNVNSMGFRQREEAIAKPALPDPLDFE